MFVVYWCTVLVVVVVAAAVFHAVCHDFQPFIFKSRHVRNDLLSLREKIVEISNKQGSFAISIIISYTPLRSTNFVRYHSRCFYSLRHCWLFLPNNCLTKQGFPYSVESCRMIYMKFYDAKGFRLKKLWMTEDGDDDDKHKNLIVWIFLMNWMKYINLNLLALSSSKLVVVVALLLFFRD